MSESQKTETITFVNPFARVDAQGRWYLYDARGEGFLAGFHRVHNGWTLRTTPFPELEALFAGRVFAGGNDIDAALKEHTL